MTSEELRESVIRAVMGARSTPPPVDPFVMDEELRATTSDPGGHHGFVTGGGGDYTDNGCFAIRGDRLINCFYWDGSQLCSVSGSDKFRINDSVNGCILTVLISPAQLPQFALFTSGESLNATAANQDTIVIPIYGFGEHHEVVIDFRKLPRGDSWATIL